MQTEQMTAYKAVTEKLARRLEKLLALFSFK